MIWTNPFWSRETHPAARSRQAERMVRAIIEQRPAMRDSSDEALCSRVEQLREAVISGDSPTSRTVMLSTFQAVDEALRRTLGVELYPVQLMAGVILAHAGIAEMRTGEGKTFTAVLPAVAQALSGRGVHVVTANAYLAERDQQQLAPVYQRLGLTCGLLPERVEAGLKRAAYRCDVTYGSAYEFGFDYLRDQLALHPVRSALPLGHRLRRCFRGQWPWDELIQRGLHFAVLDEVDHVLLDEAGSPLLLSEEADRDAPDVAAHQLAKEVAESLRSPEEVLIEPLTGLLEITPAGLERCHDGSVATPVEVLVRPWRDYVEQALRAKHLLRRDVHYIVREGRIQLVDQSTGRIFADRNWRDGLHQAVECREGVRVTAEKIGAATISRQKFFRMYQGVCGITGTATGSEHEFRSVFDLSVTPIPTHRPCQRKVLPTRVFLTLRDKWNAIVDAVLKTHQVGQPVMVGTRTIADSEFLAERLRSEGVPFQLLNGCQDATEAELVAKAGEVGSITIATNLAGRGTDIKPTPAALKLGGLFVIATELAVSSRIDRQLIGRCARQGEPGTAQFFLSGEDSLFRMAIEHDEHWKFAAERPDRIERGLQQLQRNAERMHALRRQQLLAADTSHDEMMRRVTYGSRDRHSGELMELSG